MSDLSLLEHENKYFINLVGSAVITCLSLHFAAKAQDEHDLWRGNYLQDPVAACQDDYARERIYGTERLRSYDFYMKSCFNGIEDIPEQAPISQDFRAIAGFGGLGIIMNGLFGATLKKWRHDDNEPG